MPLALISTLFTAALGRNKVQGFAVMKASKRGEYPPPVRVLHSGNVAVAVWPDSNPLVGQCKLAAQSGDTDLTLSSGVFILSI